MNDTIVAISTALGVGAISIVRLSGKDAIKIANNCFEGKDLSKVESHTINYGYIKENDEVIDEVLVSVMKSPHTYTTEDVVEINCHGGIISTNRILETMLNKKDENMQNITEAIAALQVLGYSRKEVEKALEKFEKQELSVEEIIKKALINLAR